MDPFAAAYERALPEIDPEMGEAWIEGGTNGCWKLRELRKGKAIPAVVKAFDDEFSPGASMYALMQTD